MTVEVRKFILASILISVSLVLPRSAAAHCDTVDGPVVSAAKLALNTGNVIPVLKWVRAADEAQIRTAFARTLKIRALSPEARDIADTYFYETLVRVHRAGEGEPYTGLKAAGNAATPGIALADKAIETASADELVKQITGDIVAAVRQRFARVQQAAIHSDDSVEAGRHYVAAYVDFIHYVERIHQAAATPAAHGQNDAHLAQGIAHDE